MAKSFRPKRNFTAKSDVFIGKPYEVTLDCERQELRIHDGITAGGIPTARNVDLKQSTRVSHTQYAVGDTVACPKRAGVYLVCASAGKTSSSDLNFANAVPGSIVVDGTVSWIVTVPFVSNVNGIYPDADGRVDVAFVSTVNGVEPDVDGDVSLKDSDIEKILGYTPLQEAPVTSVDGKKGDVNLSIKYQPKGNYVKSVNGSTADADGNVTVEASASGRGVGRGGVNIHFSVASYNTYTVPSSGIVSIGCECGSDGVDVYSNGTKLFTQPYTDTREEDNDDEAGTSTTVYLAKFTIPVTAGEDIGITYKGKNYNRLYNGKYVERISFDGSLMQLVVV